MKTFLIYALVLIVSPFSGMLLSFLFGMPLIRWMSARNFSNESILVVGEAAMGIGTALSVVLGFAVFHVVPGGWVASAVLIWITVYFLARNPSLKSWVGWVGGFLLVYVPLILLSVSK